MWLVTQFIFVQCFLVCNVWSDHTTCTFDGYRVLRVIPKNKWQVSFLQNFSRHDVLHLAESWMRPTHPGHPALYMMKRGIARNALVRLRKKGFNAAFLVNNVNEFVLGNQKKVVRTVFRSGMPYDSFTMDEYHEFSEIQAFLEALKSAFTERLSVFTIGESFEGRPLTVLKISWPPSVEKSGNKTQEKMVNWLECGIHAREWISPAAGLYVALKLLTANMSSNSSERDMLEAYDWYILPVANPDGYTFSWTDDRFWRKTRSLPDMCSPYCTNFEEAEDYMEFALSAEKKHDENTNDTSHELHDLCSGCCYGVDPNRNWDVNWRKADSCDHPCCTTYSGETPFSEPEVRAMADILLELQHKIVAYVSVHAYSQLWMYPYSYKKEVPPNTGFIEISEAVARAMFRSSGKVYTHGAAHEIMYASSGTSMDWVSDKTSIPYSFSIELRPTSKRNFELPAFCLPEEEIVPTCQEFFRGLWAMQNVLQNATVSSDAVRSLSVTFTLDLFWLVVLKTLVQYC